MRRWFRRLLGVDEIAAQLEEQVRLLRAVTAVAQATAHHVAALEAAAKPLPALPEIRLPDNKREPRPRDPHLG